MSFLYPLGLLGLIGIPILIIVYIIKSKYAEQTVSSTYLWDLSERFLKRRRRRNPLAGLISLLLQIVAVTAISLAIAHPVLSLPGAAREYTFLLDASGSMNLEQSGTTRFEKGKGEIRAIIEDAVNGSCFTLVRVDSNAAVVYEQVEDKEQALLLLDEQIPSHGVGDTTDAIGVAQGYFNENKGALTYWVTDTTYENSQNITVLNVAASEVNFALSDVTHQFTAQGLSVSGLVSLYGAESGEVKVELLLDGATVGETTVSLTAGQPVRAEILCDASVFSELTLRLQTQDAMSLDNASTIFDAKSNALYDILLVSERPFFLESALRSLGYRSITTLAPKQYDGQNGYGLYIFDCYSPTSIPTDGTVWLVNPDGSTDNTGFGVRDVYSTGEGLELERENASSMLYKSLTKGLSWDTVTVSEYTRCGLYRNFTTVLTYKQNPVLFVGTTASGNREVVFAFDLHNSNLPLLPDYPVLISNLLGYSFPDILERVSYTVGEQAQVNLPAGCESVRVESPTGNVQYLSLDSAVGSFALPEAGAYRITMDSSAEFYVYASMPVEESNTTPTGEQMALSGEASSEGFDGILEALPVIFLILALVFAADWMVYCYEEYQLR